MRILNSNPAASFKRGYNNLYFFAFLMQILILCPTTLLSQEESIVAEIINEIRVSKYSEKVKYLIKSKQPYKVIEAIKPFLNDTSIDVRHELMIDVYLLFKENMEDRRLRSEITKILVNFCKDQSGLIWQRASELLLEFSSADFLEESKSVLRELLKPDIINGRFILLSGVASLTDQKALLHRIIRFQNGGCSDARLRQCITWYAHLALARMGDVESIDYCINVFDNLKDKDQKFIKFANDIAYIRQYKSCDLLLKYLFSDEKMDCEGAHYSCLPYVNYILPLLAGSIQGFPVEKKYYYKDIDLQAARDWVKLHPRYKIIR
jgi:hypothetical protein